MYIARRFRAEIEHADDEDAVHLAHVAHTAERPVYAIHHVSVLELHRNIVWGPGDLVFISVDALNIFERK